MIKDNKNIFLVYQFHSKAQAIEFVASKMIELGYVKKNYVKSMIKRDKISSIAIGNYLAISHADVNGFNEIKNFGIIVVKLKNNLFEMINQW
ncbi:PTS system mannitol-specific transporter subunit IIA, partial [Mycoplasma putrefaciens]